MRIIKILLTATLIIVGVVVSGNMAVQSLAAGIIITLCIIPFFGFMVALVWDESL